MAYSNIINRSAAVLTASVFTFTMIASRTSGQESVVKEITNTITLSETKAHVTFLAADEMKGRGTGSPEIEIAANYIAAFFQQHGLTPAGESDTYFQGVKLLRQTPPSAIDFRINNQVFRIKEDLLQFSGMAVDLRADIVFAGYGTEEELAKASVKGKIVVTLVGTPSDPDLISALLEHSPQKATVARKEGAIGLVELIATPGVPFPALANYLHSERMILQHEGGTIPHFWMKNSDLEVISSLKSKKKASGSLKVEGTLLTPVAARNVAGIVQGTDPVLKDEYIVVSAHYDHVGMGPKNEAGDSIFNGARDNALGTVGLMMTAKFLSKNPPKRSVLFLAVTAEEKGLLGSAWYADHPLVPLKQTVFNFNCDGAGYNDTTRASVVGLDRINSVEALQKACEAYGLALGGDVVPEQNLYERSDNFSFARKGVPAINFSPGIKAFDQDLLKYYHQLSDDVHTLDFDYLIKFFRSYVYANVLLTNAASVPYWNTGDKFERTGKKLYGR